MKKSDFETFINMEYDLEEYLAIRELIEFAREHSVIGIRTVNLKKLLKKTERNIERLNKFILSFYIDESIS